MQKKFVTVLAKDLTAHKGAGVIFVGERQPAAVHALGNAINAALGNVGTTLTVSFPEAAVARVAMHEQLEGLVKAMTAGEVTTLVTFEGNPLYTAPGALKFADALSKVTFVHAGVLPEESGMKATWHLPAAHFLEAWGDARAWDGTASLVQPIILPLHGGRAGLSLLAQMVGEADTSDKKLVEATWMGKGLADVKAWRKALHDGIVARLRAQGRHGRGEDGRRGRRGRHREGHHRQQGLARVHRRRRPPEGRPPLQRVVADGAARLDEQAVLGQRGAHLARAGQGAGPQQRRGEEPLRRRRRRVHRWTAAASRRPPSCCPASPPTRW